MAKKVKTNEKLSSYIYGGLRNTGWRPRRRRVSDIMQGACGGTPRKDGSGQGVGNRNSSRQP